MSDAEVERWCQRHNWTEPRQLDLGIWVAFPPGGYIETPLPFQMHIHKAKPMEYFFDLALVAIVASITFAIAIIMSPCFIEPIINRRRNI